MPAASGACFEGTFGASHGSVRQIVLDFKVRKLMVSHWGMAHAPYRDDGLECTESQGNLSCGEACDGGHLSVKRRGDRGLDLEAGGLRLTIEFESFLPVVDEAGGGVLRGKYTLQPAPDQTCTKAFSPERPVLTALRAGDFSPRVQRVEQALSNLGYFSQQPDWYFTGATADALRSFQRFAGLNPTGIADAETTAKLRLFSVLRGGC
jgi:hypothetical protein